MWKQDQVVQIQVSGRCKKLEIRRLETSPRPDEPWIVDSDKEVLKKEMDVKVKAWGIAR